MTPRQRQPLAPLSLGLAIVMFALAPGTVLGQDDAPDNETAAQTGQTADTATKARTQAQTQAQPPQGNVQANPPSDDPFRPSETISEDLSVPFPVDI